MAKKVGTLIKEARTSAGLTQEQLAKKVKTLSAADISKAERGEKELTTEQLKETAKALGITQKSLLDAAKGTTSTAKKTTAKTSAAKTTTAKTSTAKTSSAKTSSAKTSSAKTSSSDLRLSATEKLLIEKYREADSDTKKAVMALLKGEAKQGSILETLLGGAKGLGDLFDGKKVNELLDGVLKK